MFQHLTKLFYVLMFSIIGIQKVFCDCPYTKDQLYALSPRASQGSLALDAYDPHELHLWDFLGDEDQAFQIICDADDTVNIYHPKEDKYLDVNKNTTDWPWPTYVGAKSGNDTQRWIIQEESIIYNIGYMSNLDVTASSFNRGILVGVYPPHDTPNQIWTLVPLN